MPQPVFVNRILNMKKIKYIGLDMDHTLIRYNTENFEALVYQIVINKLAEQKKYPSAVKNFTFNFPDAIRGLIIDSKNGNILKLSRYGAIRQSYHGTRLISFAEQKEIYRSIYVDLKDSNYMAIDTSFSIAFCVLYGQLVDYKDEHPDELPSYSEIARDVLQCVDTAHSDGSIKNHIAQHLEKFVKKDPELVAGLKRYTHYGKKIFILTNSDYYYSKLLLDFAINPFLENNQTWQDLFEIVITLANKPRFFYDNLRFLTINPQDGTMTNTTGLITHGIYQGGNARKFTDDLKLNGDEILYIGDHIYGDILRLKKDCNWRTALVVEELGEEIQAQANSMPIEQEIIAAMEMKTKLEKQYVELHSKIIEDQFEKGKPQLSQLQQEIVAIDTDISSLLQKQQTFYNKRWGRTFRAGAEESYFAYQVDRFACIYMEKLTDLLEQSPITYFRAHRRLLAHDLEIAE
ncbi:cytosolic IMP-GMP specific 5'-nucleotidase [Legionella birminghamensis]|uniref:Cytosolic IMP-GMP specific 5'-nucleotidase n=1 Tax=Legionella birminghamensis TaxID=28083 RepID=A0A378I8M4_9GAMM|nr:HAD-IG family 5'-nucleotidase [Legionella birminghamensis]KTC74696.1 cytosolic IMP-GMP specific 5'-nucleotidase [Legionella birminghamensis]STX31499.1 cytosolic IMP-GMP specific 5'-nucleotidase [Legionella birminghamensis]